MQVVICGPNLRDQSKGDFHVHAPGCGDLHRGAKRDPMYSPLRSDLVEVSTLADLVRYIYPPADFDYDPNDEKVLNQYGNKLHVFPCCALGAKE